jgi:hypothetical protein
MKFILEISLDNSAFDCRDDEFPNGEYSAETKSGGALSGILADLAEDIDECMVWAGCNSTIIDANGQTVGSWKVVE